MFTLTAAAAEQIRRAAQAQNDKPVLRVAAKVDDDGGMSYGMGFDEERENDLVLENEGVTVLISPPSQPLLAEASLDFVQLHPGEYQFVFMNPRERELCAGQQQGGCSSCGSRGQCG